MLLRSISWQRKMADVSFYIYLLPISYTSLVLFNDDKASFTTTTKSSSIWYIIMISHYIQQLMKCNCDYITIKCIWFYKKLSSSLSSCHYTSTHTAPVLHVNSLVPSSYKTAKELGAMSTRYRYTYNNKSNKLCHTPFADLHKTYPNKD